MNSIKPSKSRFYTSNNKKRSIMGGKDQEKSDDEDADSD